MTDPIPSVEAIRAGETVDLERLERAAAHAWMQFSKNDERAVVAEIKRLRALLASRSSETDKVMTKTYPCGCSATGTPDIPNYCPEHGLTPNELRAAALLCERWGHQAFKQTDRVLVSLPEGSDWITMTPDLLDGLVAKVRAMAQPVSPSGAEEKAK